MSMAGTNGSWPELSLTEKVGQLLLIGFEGKKPAPEVARFLAEGKAGGVVLLARNFDDAVEAAELIRSLQALATARPTGLPLLIAIDQEGGPVVRLRRGVTVFPGNMALAATGNPEYAFQAAAAVAGELRALGINLNLAPVLDVNNNPLNPVIGIRSFGEDPQMVAALGTLAIKGYQSRGLAAVAKHFPGHGDTAVDSHRGRPRIGHPLSRLEAVELVPFRAAIAAGVAGIMTTHCAFPVVDPEQDRPATLSPVVLTGLLREKLGFPGVLLTDCLEMRGVAAEYAPEQAAVLAVQAGADLALLTHSFERQLTAHRLLVAAVRSGKIPRTRLETAVQRVVRLKQQLFAGGLSVPGRPEGVVHGGEGLGVSPAPVDPGGNQRLAQQIAAAAITLVKNEAGLLPLRLTPEEELYLLSFHHQGLTLAEEGTGHDSGLSRALQKRHPRTRERVLPCSPTAEMIAMVLRELEARKPALVLVATADAGLAQGQVVLVRKIAATGLPLVVAALRTPYELALFPEVTTFVAAYSCQPVTLEALAGLLWGEYRPTGKLPVSIPGLYPAGYGRNRF